MNNEERTHERERAVARSTMYNFLARSFLYPTSEHFAYLNRKASKEISSEFFVAPGEHEALKKELSQILSIHQDLQNPLQREELETEYNRLFAHLGSAKCPPYETEFGLENIYQKTEAMADIGGFYSAFGLEIASHSADRVDFLSTELEFMAYLTLNQAYAVEHDRGEQLEISVDTQKKFLQEHLGRWISTFSKILQLCTQSHYYRCLGDLLENFIESEACFLNVQLNKVTKPTFHSDDKPIPFNCDSCSAFNANGNTSNGENVVA